MGGTRAGHANHKDHLRRGVALVLARRKQLRREERRQMLDVRHFAAHVVWLGGERLGLAEVLERGSRRTDRLDELGEEEEQRAPGARREVQCLERLPHAGKQLFCGGIGACLQQQT